MKIENSVALVTGGNRGLARGACWVYAGDVTVLVNNAGIFLGTDYLRSDIADIRREFETNFFGPLHVTRRVKQGLAADPAVLYPQLASWQVRPARST